jgi:hypothetical protein
MKASLATLPAFGIDTVQALDFDDCSHLLEHGFDFVVRYLGGLTPKELERILISGLALMPVTYSRAPGWAPTGELGERDGDKAVERLRTLGMPDGVTVWLDLEGCAGPASGTADWVNAWSLVIKSAGYQAGLYVGAQPGGLGPEELWRLPYTTRYWRSCSRVPEPANRGWCMQQLRPPNIKLGQLTVDVDVIESDFRGGLPTWAVGS